MTKVCRTCGCSKPTEAFRTRTRKLPTRTDQWTVTTCRECEAVAQRSNPDRKAIVAAWRTRNPERVRELNRKHLAAHADKRSQMWKSWYAHNRDRVIAKAHLAVFKRRALLSGSPGVSLVQWQQIVQWYARRCAYCGDGYQVIEHVVPLSRGGLHEPLNVVPACSSCNARKHAKTGIEFHGRDPVRHAALVTNTALSATH